MECPNCKKTGQSDVIDSRTIKGGKIIRRRRQCLRCAHRWTTHEVRGLPVYHLPHLRNLLARSALLAAKFNQHIAETDAILRDIEGVTGEINEQTQES